MDLFGTAGIRGDVEQRVTPDLALAVGRAVAAEMRERGASATDGDRPEVVLARDGRVTGAALVAAMEAGLAAGGVRVRRAGRLPTPGLAYASRERYGVMVTASHNPPSDNGIKLFRDGTEFDDALEATIEDRVATESDDAPWNAWTEPTRVDVLDDYLEAIVAYAGGFGADLDGLRIAVDCGNGMSGPATPTVLRELGATVVTLNGNVDGYFPGRGSKPTPESLRDLRAFVADANDGIDDPGHDGAGFAFGIGHDGDADRIVIVDADGEVVHEDTVLAILAERYVRASDAADPVVVTTPNASGRIDERVQAAGGRVERVRLGALHEGIARVYESDGNGDAEAAASDTVDHPPSDTVAPDTAGTDAPDTVGTDEPDTAGTDALDSAGNDPLDAAGGDVFDPAGGDVDETVVAFAAEPWKHIHTSFGGWTDGICSAAVIARLVADEGLATLREPVTERPYRKVSVDCPDDRKRAVMDRLEASLPEAFPGADVDTDHGVRLTLPDAAWTLVRPSGTEPYVRIYAESDDVDELTETVRRIVTDAIDDAE